MYRKKEKCFVLKMRMKTEADIFVAYVEHLKLCGTAASYSFDVDLAKKYADITVALDDAAKLDCEVVEIEFEKRSFKPDFETTIVESEK